MFRAVARRAVASVGALSSAVGGVGTGGSTRAIRPRPFSSGAGGSMDGKIPLMSVALGAAATATAYEAARSLEKPNPTPAARPTRTRGQIHGEQIVQGGRGGGEEETEKKETEKKEPEKKEPERKEPEKKDRRRRKSPRPRWQNPTPISSTPSCSRNGGSF